MLHEEKKFRRTELYYSQIKIKIRNFGSGSHREIFFKSLFQLLKWLGLLNIGAIALANEFVLAYDDFD